MAQRSVSRRDPISVVEACYSLGGSDQQWLGDLATAAGAAFGEGGGAIAAVYDLGARPDWIELLGVARSVDTPVELERALFHRPDAGPDEVVAMQRLLGTTGILTARRHLVAHPQHHFRPIVEQLSGDGAAIVALDPTERGCVVAIPIRTGGDSSRMRYLWRRIATHIAAGFRLRTSLVAPLAAGANPSDHAEAVLSESGKLEHASQAAQSPDAREALRDSLARLHAARSSERRDPRTALDLWRAMVEGRWSVVEHFERGGRRYYLACRNDPSLSPVRSLTEREQQVLAYAVVGHSNKLIAYATGLSLSTVATHLGRARRKLGSKISPAELRKLWRASTPRPAPVSPNGEARVDRTEESA